MTLQTARGSWRAHHLPSLVNGISVCVVVSGGMVLVACESAAARMGPEGTSDFRTLHYLFLPSAKEQAETAS